MLAFLRACVSGPFACAVCCIASTACHGLTLEDLRNDSHLTPQRFAAYFTQFGFCFHASVQAPEVFLQTESGDCDDYATLAAEVLRSKGYTPHLISVRTKKTVHVVCYIDETKSYLDYSKRRSPGTMVFSQGSLAEVAGKVAKDFKTRWTSVSEFTFDNGQKRLVKTVVPEKQMPSVFTRTSRFLRGAVKLGGKMPPKPAGRDACPTLVAASPRCAVSPIANRLEVEKF